MQNTKPSETHKNRNQSKLAKKKPSETSKNKPLKTRKILGINNANISRKRNHPRQQKKLKRLEIATKNQIDPKVEKMKPSKPRKCINLEAKKKTETVRNYQETQHHLKIVKDKKHQKLEKQYLETTRNSYKIKLPESLKTKTPEIKKI